VTLEQQREFEQHIQMKELASYLNRGRRFEHLSDDELGNAWGSAFRAVYYRHERHLDMDDLGAEHWMRSIEPPWSAVQTELRQFWEKLCQMSVAERDTLFPGVSPAIDEFMAERNKPPH
jgi:hypothetical protein